MSDGISISGNALPWLRRVDADMRSNGRIRKSMGVAAAKTVREHLRDLDRKRHRGFSTRNFYGGLASSAREEVSARDIAVVVGNSTFPGSALAQRYFGGTIRPKKAKALTIPVKGSDAARSGKRASEYDNLFAVTKNDTGSYRGFLARVTENGTLEPLFWLRASVDQDPDPTVLPTAETLGTAMADAADRTMRRIN